MQPYHQRRLLIYLAFVWFLLFANAHPARSQKAFCEYLPLRIGNEWIEKTTKGTTVVFDTLRIVKDIPSPPSINPNAYRSYTAEWTGISKRPDRIGNCELMVSRIHKMYIWSKVDNVFRSLRRCTPAVGDTVEYVSTNWVSGVMTTTNSCGIVVPGDSGGSKSGLRCSGITSYGANRGSTTTNFISRVAVVDTVIIVPAGLYTTFMLECENMIEERTGSHLLNPPRDRTKGDRWNKLFYAKGVGLVKAEGYSEDGQVCVWELCRVSIMRPLQEEAVLE